jgi:hypothetical protein
LQDEMTSQVVGNFESGTNAQAVTQHIPHLIPSTVADSLDTTANIRHG